MLEIYFQKEINNLIQLYFNSASIDDLLEKHKDFFSQYISIDLLDMFISFFLLINMLIFFFIDIKNYSNDKKQELTYKRTVSFSKRPNPFKTIGLFGCPSSKTYLLAQIQINDVQKTVCFL
jgi:hypothetical protein